MQVSYKREMNHNYLMIESEFRENSYEARMMANNYIEGLLRFRIKKVDTHCYFCYEITSKQPLERLLENRPLGLVELQMLVVTIARTLNRMEEYLLSENQILVKPEFIYVEPDRFQTEFCLVPGIQTDFPREFSRFLEYLLGKVDYQDQACVVLAYGLYRESLKDNYGMEDLLRFLGNALPSGVDEEKEGENQILSDHDPEVPSLVLASEDDEKRREKWSERFKQWIAGKFKKKKIVKEEPLSWQMVFNEIEEKEEGEEENGAKRSKELKIPGEYIPEKDSMISDSTMLLSERAKSPSMRYLMSLEAGEPDIGIAYYPFIIGKQDNLVDYQLNKNTVSRLHLRLDEEEGRYWITDLNSTNGTIIGGRLLENNEKAEVFPGDEVTVAGIHFRFT